jgi:hypothetical protein
MADESSLVSAAKKRVPSFNWVMGAAALFFLAAGVIRRGQNLASVLLVVGALLVGAMALIALNWISKLKPQKTNRMAVATAAALLFLLIASLGLVLCSATFDWPFRLRSWINWRTQEQADRAYYFVEFTTGDPGSAALYLNNKKISAAPLAGQTVTSDLTGALFYGNKVPPGTTANLSIKCSAGHVDVDVYQIGASGERFHLHHDTPGSDGRPDTVEWSIAVPRFVTP